MGTTKDIREAVQAELTIDPLVDATDITVRNMNGEVGLNGTVEFGRQRQAAELAVAGLTGVRRVKDEIEITSDVDPADVTGLVRDALDRNALVPDDSDVHIDTSGDTVTLGGHVRTWAEHDAVVGATWMAAGVVQVRDYLDVSG
jgi:osmotically-inducible protein OsmY